MSAAAAPRKRTRPLWCHAWLSVLGGLVMALVMVQSAAAYWTSIGTGSGSGPVGTLGAPTISSATPGSGKATLTWTAVTAPGLGSVSYYVLRDGGSPAGNCPIPAPPTSVLTCTDVGLSLGTHTYTVTVVYHSWTATSSTATVTIVAVPTAAFSSGPALGYNNWLPTFVSGSGFTGSVTISWSYAWSGYTYRTTTPADGSGNFAWNGLENCIDGYNVYHTTDQTVTVTATDGTQTAIGTGILLCSLQPNPSGGPPGPASKLAFTQSPGNTVAGEAFASQPQVTVQDQYGNTVTTDASNVAIAVTGGAATLTGCAANPKAASGGVATFSGCTIRTAGTYTLTATDGLLTSATSSSFIVSPAGISSFRLTAATTTPTAGAPDNLTITALDAYGNTVISYIGSHNLTFAGASTIGTFSPTVTDSSGSAINFGTATAISFTAGVATVSGTSNGGMTLYKAETASIVVSDGSGHSNGAGLSVTVSPAAASKLSFTQSPGNTVAGVAFASQPQVTVQDQYGNTVTTDSSSVTIAVTGATPPPVSGCASNPTAASSGVATFSGCTVTKAGTYTLTATDGSLTSAVSGSFTISAAAEAGIMLSNITIHPSPDVSCSNPIGASNTCSSTSEPNSSGNVLEATLTLEDQFGNAVTNNTGSPIGIDLVIASGEGTVAPSALSIANGFSVTSLPFTLTRHNGDKKTVTMTATATVNGTTQTLTVTLSS